MSILRVFLVSVGLLTSACAPAPTADERLVASAIEAVATKRMNAHFADVTLIQTALLEGKLSTAKRHAVRLGEDVHSDLVRQAITPRVGEISAADTIPQAAQALAKLAGNCGNCHQQHGVWESVQPPGLAPDSSGPAGMYGHIWAADRMWEGLIGPSSKSWNDGAAMFTTAPLTLPDKMRRTDPEVIAPLRGEIRDIGRAALNSVTQAERVDLYGRLLPLCARCHGDFRNDQ